MAFLTAYMPDQKLRKRITNSLAVPLQFQASQLGTALIKWRDIPVMLSGNVISIPGQRLFQYLDDAGERCAVESADVNAYIREAMGEQFSAKDFRTWAGTVSAARALRELEPPA